MAHQFIFDTLRGKIPFVSTQKSWHNLGQRVERAMTAEEAMEKGGLNWEVVKIPNYVKVGEEFKIAPNSFSTMRTDTGAILGTRLAQSYTVIQNRDVFSPFNEIFQREARIETAGSLFGGNKVFMAAKLPDHIRVNGSDDLVEKYIFFTTSHDGSGAVIGAITPVRIVCNNTLNVALKSCSNKVVLRHNVKEVGLLSRFTNLMDRARLYAQDVEEVFTAMARKPYTDEQVKQLVYRVFASDRQAIHPEDFSARLLNLTELVMNYAQSAESQQLATTKGTMFGAYNAISGFFQNVRRYPSDEHKMNSILFDGYGQVKGQLAFNLLAADL